MENPKPAPDVFLKAARQLGFSPEECIVIEDSENGCKAAKNAGITCIGYKNPDSGKTGSGKGPIWSFEGYEEIDCKFMENGLLSQPSSSGIGLRDQPASDPGDEERRYSPADGNLPGRRPPETPAREWPDLFQKNWKALIPNRTYMYELCDMGYWSVLKKRIPVRSIGRAGVEPKFWNRKKNRCGTGIYH